MIKNKSETFMFIGETIKIRETRESDAHEWYSWFNDPEINKYLIHGVIPNTIENQIKYRETHINGENNKIIFSIVSKNNNKLIGTCSINISIPEFVRRGEISIIIGNKAFHQGATYIEVTKWQINHAFNLLNLNSLFAETAIDNRVVVLTLERLGFKKIGTPRQKGFKNGEYIDGVYLDLLKSEWINK